jgi:diguanylate cyclase (GGDEF)-like protein
MRFALLARCVLLLCLALFNAQANAAVRYVCQTDTNLAGASWRAVPADGVIRIVEADFGRGMHCWIAARADAIDRMPQALTLKGLTQFRAEAEPAEPGMAPASALIRTNRSVAFSVSPDAETRVRLDVLLPIGGALRIAVRPLAPFLMQETQNGQILSALLAVLFAMGLIAAAFAAAMRDTTVGWYTGLTLSLGVVWAMINGFAISPTGLAIHHPLLAQYLLLGGYSAALLCGAQFGRSFTQLAAHSPRLDRVIVLASCLLLAYTLIGFIPALYADAVAYYNLAGLIMLLLLLLPGAACLLSGHYRVGAMYLVGWLPILVAWIGAMMLYMHLMPGYPAFLGQIALGLRAMGLLPDWLGSPHVRELALLCQSAIFMLALADRASRLREARERATLTDKITQLPNRISLIRSVSQRLNKVRHAERPLTLALFDVDRFGTINESLGYEVGDQMLAEVATRLQLQFGANTLLARVGGNQFAVLLDEQVSAGTLRMAIASMTRHTFEIDSQLLDINLSAGAAYFPAHGQDADLLMRRAEIALAAGRREKLAAQVYHAELDRDRRFQLSLVSALRDAIGKRELQLFLQPKVARQTGMVTGAEALLRWHHPQLGLVSPAEFLPFAEQTGLIVELTRWTLEQAIQLAHRLQLQGQTLRLSVNLSAHDLADPTLPAYVSEFLMHNRADARLICMEITESEIMRDPQLAISTMKALRKLGFELALDDFGTGNSSLAYLQEMPVSEIKIDRSFIQQARRSERGRELLVGIVALCHSLELRTVAEGVENEADWQMVADAHCQEVQGYFVSPPLPSSEFEEWLLLNQPFLVPLG